VVAALEGFEPVCVDFEPVCSHHASVTDSPSTGWRGLRRRPRAASGARKITYCTRKATILAPMAPTGDEPRPNPERQRHGDDNVQRAEDEHECRPRRNRARSPIIGISKFPALC
jgi:hypothetical protein